MTSGILSTGIPDSGVSFGYSMWILVLLITLALAAVHVHHDFVFVLGAVILGAVVLNDRRRWPH